MKFYAVDDEPVVLSLLERILGGAGHSVVSTSSPLHALEQIPLLRPDCVIIDLMMPEMDGFELCHRLRRIPELAATKIIVLSSKSYDFDRRRARELGADGYIVKPIRVDSLLASIEEFVSNRIALTYWGVRGTLPSSGPHTLRYGGRTSCVGIAVGGEPLYIFDCGSGIKKISDRIMGAAQRRFSGRIFISHTHWDHINAVPFFAPLYVPGNRVEIYGPLQGELTIERAVCAQMDGAYFPITIREFGAQVVYRDLREETLDFGAVKIDTMLLKHPGTCLGYRFRCHGRTICYVTDNEFYLPADPRRDERYLNRLADFVRGADLLITDATYRDHEYPSKVDYGHSCVGEVASFAVRAEVKRLHLFHHDPDQSDDDIDCKLEEARAHIARLGGALECDAPGEGAEVIL